MIGNMLPVPIIFFFAALFSSGVLTNLLSVVSFLECLKKGHSGVKSLKKFAGDKGIFWALLLFVEFHLGTGAWTVRLGIYLDWDFKRSVLAVMLELSSQVSLWELSLLFGVDTLAH
ncbi:MAG: small multi-drug export protein [Streptococcus sp.]